MSSNRVNVTATLGGRLSRSQIRTLAAVLKHADHVAVGNGPLARPGSHEFGQGFREEMFEEAHREGTPIHAVALDCRHGVWSRLREAIVTLGLEASFHNEQGANFEEGIERIAADGSVTEVAVWRGEPSRSLSELRDALAKGRALVDIVTEMEADLPQPVPPLELVP